MPVPGTSERWRVWEAAGCLRMQPRVPAVAEEGHNFERRFPGCRFRPTKIPENYSNAAQVIVNICLSFNI